MTDSMRVMGQGGTVQDKREKLSVTDPDEDLRLTNTDPLNPQARIVVVPWMEWLASRPADPEAEARQAEWQAHDTIVRLCRRSPSAASALAKMFLPVQPVREPARVERNRLKAPARAERDRTIVYYRLIFASGSARSESAKLAASLRTYNATAKFAAHRRAGTSPGNEPAETLHRILIAGNRKILGAEAIQKIWRAHGV